MPVHDMIYSSKFEEFRTFQNNTNRRLLIYVASISLAFEFIYYVLGRLFITSDYTIATFFDQELLHYQHINIIIYFFLLFILYKFYYKVPELVSVLAIGYMLFEKVYIFVNNPEYYTILVFWILLTVLLAWNYLGPKIVNSAIVLSFAYTVYFLLDQQVDIAPFAPYVWMMMITLMTSPIMSARNFTMRITEFMQKAHLIEENELANQKLNVDELTGLMTKHALLEYVNTSLIIKNHRTFIVVMDLDDLKVCNELFGFEQGDIYIQIFSKIIKFLINSEHDVIARYNEDEFIGVFSSYSNEKSLTDKLKRYNQMMKDEYSNQRYDSRFVPNVSYGVSEIYDATKFREVYAVASDYMMKAKNENKKRLNDTNFYRPYINYTSLFKAGVILAAVWLPEEGWPLGYVTENVYELLGYTNEELLIDRQSYLPFIHPDDVEKYMNGVGEHIKNKASQFEQKYRLQKKDGSYIWVRDYSVPVWNQDELLQINGYIYDISFEMEAEMLIQDKNQRLNDIIEATNVGTWEWNLSTDIAICNERYAEITGCVLGDDNQIKLQSIVENIHPEDVRRRNDRLKEHFDGERSYYNLEYRLLTEQGKYIWVYDRGRIMKRTSENKPVKMMGTITDITDLKEKEARLHHSEKLNALGRLSGGIAHDINNELMMIRSLLDLSKEQDNLDQYRTHVESIIQITNRAADTVRQLLSFTKHHMYEAKTINLNDVVSEFSRVIEHTFKKDIIVQVNMIEEICYVDADKSMLENVFINLCINAKEAMEQGRILKVTLDRVNIDRRLHTFTGDLEKNLYARLQFKDQGEGIDDERLTKIFEPFFTTKETGNGIGLATVATIIREHGGGINVSSTVGEGSTFVVYLPIVEKKQTMTIQKSDIKYHLNQLPNILLVDDEPVIVEVMKQFLELKGCHVKTFTNPVEAIKYFEANSQDIHIVLLDMLMPEMKGTEVLEKLIEINKTIKVLFLSGYSNGIDISDMNRDNICGFIQKPVELETVFDTIMLAVDQEIE